MIKKILISLFVVIFVYNNNIYSQNKKYLKELPLLITRNSQFDSIYVSAVCSIRKCEYYTKSIVFTINFLEKNGNTYMDLTTVYDKNIALIDIYSSPFGYFLFKGHYFFVFSNTLPKMYELTKTKKMFAINNSMNFQIVADFTEWLYLYKDNKIFLEKVINECDLKPK